MVGRCSILKRESIFYASNSLTAIFVYWRRTKINICLLEQNGVKTNKRTVLRILRTDILAHTTIVQTQVDFLRRVETDSWILMSYYDTIRPHFQSNSRFPSNNNRPTLAITILWCFIGICWNALLPALLALIFVNCENFMSVPLVAINRLLWDLAEVIYIIWCSNYV